MRIAIAIVVIGLAYQTNYQFIVNHFLENGAFLLDSGLFAHLVYQNPSLQHAPPLGGGSYLSTHFTPWLQLNSLVSFLVPLSPPFYYAFTQGAVYAIVAGAGVVALNSLFKEPRSTWGLLPLSLLFAFNGIVVASVGYPHFEPVYAGWAILFLVSFFRRHNTAAWVFFVLTLIVREDTGFHLFGFTFLLFLLSWKEPELEERRRLLGIFSALALCYPLVVMVVQKTYYPGDSALGRIYLGDPPYAHVSADFLFQRMLDLQRQAAHIWVPWLLLIPGALYLRSWSFGVGFVAVLPWFLFNALAKADTAGSLFSYYAFPLIVSLLWPAIWYGQKSPPAERRTGMLVLQTLILVSSFGLFVSNHDRWVLRQMFTRASCTIEQYEEFETFVDSRLAEGDVHFDCSMAALFTQKIPRDQLVRNDRDNSDVRTVIGFLHGIDRDLVQKVGAENRLENSYTLQGLPVYLLSAEAEKLDGQWVPDTLVPPLPERLTVAGLKVGENAQRNFSDFSVTSEKFSPQPSVVVFGPYMRLQEGTYAVEFSLEAYTSSHDGWVLCEVATDSGMRIVAQKRLEGEELLKLKSGLDVELFFQVDTELASQTFEFRVWKKGRLSLTVRQLELVETGPQESGR
jgi:hypothetical protein